MGGRAEPPEGTPEGGSGGEDEFRPVVFDESFVRAARIQELSAQERMSGGTRPVRRQGTRGGGLPRQALALMLLVSLAFAVAVYMGTKHPYAGAAAGSAQLSMTVIPLQPGAGGIPTGARTTSTGGTPTPSVSSSATGSASAPGTASGSALSSASGSASASASASPMPPGPFAGTPLADYPVGLAGIGLPYPRHTAHFSGDQVLHSLKTVLNYLRASSLDPGVLMGGSTDSVRALLATGQDAQFDQSLSDPRDDQQHEVTGWLVRFDPSKVRLASVDDIRVWGSLTYQELDPGTLEVVSDHTFVYVLTPAPAAAPSTGAVSPSPSASGAAAAQQAVAQPPTVLFTVRREIRYRFTLADLNANQVELVDSVVQAGPMACNADVSSYLQPIFPPAAAPVGGTAAAGKHPGDPTGRPVVGPVASPDPGPSIDPFYHTRSAWDVCGVLAGPTL